jgi:hypothetical protein
MVTGRGGGRGWLQATCNATGTGHTPASAGAACTGGRAMQVGAAIYTLFMLCCGCLQRLARVGLVTWYVTAL